MSGFGEQILAAVFRGDEAEALAVVKPFDDASLGGAHGDVPFESVDKKIATVLACANTDRDTQETSNREFKPGRAFCNLVAETI